MFELSLLSRVIRKSHFNTAKTAFDPGCVKTQKSKRDEDRDNHRDENEKDEPCEVVNERHDAP